MRIEFALGYGAVSDPEDSLVPIAGIYPLVQYKGEWLVTTWMEDTRLIMRHAAGDVGA